jgi:hypothetical protein
MNREETARKAHRKETTTVEDKQTEKDSDVKPTMGFTLPRVEEKEKKTGNRREPRLLRKVCAASASSR